MDMAEAGDARVGSSGPTEDGQAVGADAAASAQGGERLESEGSRRDKDSGTEEREILGGLVAPVEETPKQSEPRVVPEPGKTPPAWSGKVMNWGPYRRWNWYRQARPLRVEFAADRGRDENEATKLSENESLAVPAVWAVELYTPSTVTGLFDGIRRLGWEYGHSQDEGVSKWMHDVRNGRLAGWTSLGLVSPPGKPLLMRERTANLPTGVAAALPTLFSVTPSVTALVMCFFLSDVAASCLDQPMRADYSTYIERDPLFRRRHLIPYLLWNRSIRMGGRYHSPGFQRRVAVQETLDGLENLCTEWLAENVPGVFAIGLRRGLFPTAMLLVSEETSLLTADARQLRALDGTAMDQWYDAWTSDEWAKCRMTLPHGWRKEKLRLQFGCRRRDAFPDQPGYSEPTSNWTIAHRANDLVHGLATRWALSCLLDGYHHKLSGYRDRSASEHTFRPIRDLRNVQNLVRTEAYDILAASAEVKALAESRRTYARGVLEMQHVDSNGPSKIDLVDELRSSQTQRGDQLERDSHLLLSTLTMTAEATQVISNVRIQRFLTVLTAISIAIAIVALVVAVNAA
jgi:hypothetical protein